ncbi:MAG TPA: biopolymer transporter ExbD [Phycisphaerales bacterium]|jgi:biopolymer transport protein ExbD|nr:biopolymer transporter ExbD [Phycisphaerales bacterium]
MRLAPKPSRRSSDRVTINLAAMIDVSFLLLFYFMVATMLSDRETRLSTNLQTQSGGSGSVGDFQTQNIEVRIVDGTPAYVVGMQVARDRQHLASVLAPLPKATGAFVKVFDGVNVGFAVTAVQTAHDAGFEKVTYVPSKTP